MRKPTLILKFITYCLRKMTQITKERKGKCKEKLVNSYEELSN